MRTLKFKLVFPLLAIACAISAAFATQKEDSENLLLEQGYVHTTQPCKKAVECSGIGINQCTWEEALVFAMDGSTGCNRPLFYN